MFIAELVPLVPDINICVANTPLFHKILIHYIL